MGHIVVPRPFNRQLLYTTPRPLLGSKALDRDEVILAANIGIGMEGKVRGIGEGLLPISEHWPLRETLSHLSSLAGLSGFSAK